MVEGRDELRFSLDQPLSRGTMLIEASAGTGKTYALSNLLLRLLVEEKLPIQQILVVTFTRAAAAELRSRIRERIEKTLHWLDTESSLLAAKGDASWDVATQLSHEDPVWKKIVAGKTNQSGSGLAEMRQLLLQALQDFDGATITTIHGFCQLVLGFAAFETGVDFEAKLSEKVDDLLQEVVDDFWTAELAEAKLEWYSYLVECCKISRSRLFDLAKILEADPHIWITPQISASETAYELWYQSWLHFREAWSTGSGQDLALKIAEWAKLKLLRKQKDYNTRRPQKIAKLTEDWLAEHEPSTLPDLGMQAKVEYFSQSKIAKAFLDSDQYPGHHLAQSAQRWLQSGGEAFLWHFSQWTIEEIAKRKRKQKIMSFSDLLHRLADALQSPATAQRLVEELNGRYQAALIDEFQDTDPIQWSIFNRLFVQPKKGWSIFVGDPKQSIYGFRGADIYAYLQARLSSGDRRYTMGENWRSDPRYIKAVNCLFDRPDLFLQKEIQYPPVKAARDTDRLEFSDLDWSPLQVRCFVPDLNCDCVSEQPGDGDSQSEVSTVSSYDDRWCREHLHHVVADDVVELLNSSTQITISGSDFRRKALPQDIAILVRSNLQAETMRTALRKRGVPAVISGVGSVFETEEAEAMQRLLDAWLQPGSSAKLRAVLVSVLFAKRAEDLLAIDDDGWNHWIERMHVWSYRWRKDGVAAALRQMATEESIPEHLVRGQGGNRRLSNWLHLCELLHLASEEQRLGPVALRHWLQEKRFLGESPTESELLRLESDAEAVTILTVHRSKGLEFGVVFCPYLWQAKQWRANRPEHQQLRFHDRRKGHRLSLDLSMDDRSGSKAKHVEWVMEDRVAENMRLAYVAMTRARNACVVYWGPFPNCDSSPLASLLRSRVKESDSSPLVQSSESDSWPESLYLPWSQMDARRWWHELRELAAQSQGCIGASPVLESRFRRYRPSKAKRTNIEVQTFTRSSIAARWTRTSFSSLTAMAAYFHGISDSQKIREASKAGEADLTPKTEKVDLTRNDSESRKTARTQTGSGTTGETFSAPPNRESASLYGDSFSLLRPEIQDELIDAELATPAFDENTQWMHGEEISSTQILVPKEPYVDGPNAEGASLLPGSVLTRLPFEGVPGGTVWGNHIHRILERFDFSSLDREGGRETLRGFVQELRKEGGSDESDKSSAILSILEEGISKVLGTPLGPNIHNLRLQDIDPGDRLHELRFDFPVANTGFDSVALPGLRLDQIARVLRETRSKHSPIDSDYLQRLAALGGYSSSEAPLDGGIHGFMTGSIDLVFRQRRSDSNRWFVVDYKSNRLHSGLTNALRTGDPQDGEQLESGNLSDWEAYRPSRLDTPMADHHYILQYHIYLLALHRYLRSRLGSRYDYDRDIGGVLYLFVRGMAGANPPVDESDRPYGVFFDRPEAKVIDRLDQLMAGELEFGEFEGEAEHE